MRRVLDGFTRATTRALHRLHPGIPVVKRWPGTRDLLSAVYSRLVRPGQDAVAWRLARLHRARLDDTHFIGVTGSAGKTMTKFFIVSVLSTRFEGRSTTGTRNNVQSAARSLLRFARKGDGFHVVELSADERGAIGAQAKLIRPSIGVVTNIGRDHYPTYGSQDAIAVEKGTLIRLLPADGVAVLNADDPRVIAMRHDCRARVITYGVSPDAMVRADNVADAWPDRLSFDLLYDGQRVPCQTQLSGTHWVSSALAAVATGVALGVPLEAAAAGLGQVGPNQGRMSPLPLPDGVTFIRDDWKASVSTIPPAVEFLGRARARRRVAIVGTISDTAGTAGTIYTNTARLALESADMVCFVGPRSFAAMRAQPKDQPGRLRAFAGVRAAHEFLSTYLEPGDLVLLKGSNPADHLYRLALARMQPVACWRMDCKRKTYCNTCDLVGVASESVDRVDDQGMDEAAATTDDAAAPVTPPADLVIVGLGNPGEDFRDTPHNVGYAVVDHVVASLGARWREEPEAATASADWQGTAVLFVKPTTKMNLSGGALRRLSQRLGFEAAHCILVFDDIDLPLGTVRTRMRGSDGGHRGVRSVLEAFQTDQVRRIKVGVKRAGDACAARDAVLRRFDTGDQPVVDDAVAQAGRNLFDLVHRPPGTPKTPSARPTATVQ
jgi:aminoacyl-tRNA hydrolase